MADNLDVDYLISLVEARPVIWDKSKDEYKDKILKTEAWKEVCLNIIPSFDDKDNREKTKLDGEGVESRILFATRASIKEFPYFADIGICGAAIISNRWLLTAAHCIERQKIIQNGQYATTVYVGGETQQNSQRIITDYVAVHPSFNPEESKMFNDIALLRLSQYLRFTDKIQPVKLPYGDIPFQVAKFAGKGKNEQGHLSEALMKVDLKKLTPQECSSIVDPNLWQHLASTSICTIRTDGRPGICYGDSGSPLVANNVVVGVVSFFAGPGAIGSMDKCFRSRHTVFTKVSAFLPWIKSVTGLY